MPLSLVRTMIIPFFIPHAGCPHRCVFCNQKRITGGHGLPPLATIVSKIEEYLKKSAHEAGRAEVAFYGGSFTAIGLDIQRAYLTAVSPFIESGMVQSIRISTRPDCIDEEIIRFLIDNHVETVELGVQSMDDRVLELSGRGHKAIDTIKATRLLRKKGMGLGIQLMAGLPGDTPSGFMETIHKTIELRPDFVRLYPLLVIADTPLAEMYKQGRYTPLTLTEAVEILSRAVSVFEKSGIRIIRVGLQPTDELLRPGTILAGPFHPALGQLVASARLLEAMKAALMQRRGNQFDSAVIIVHPKDLSTAIGQKRSNIIRLKKEFGLRNLSIRTDSGIKRFTAAIG